ncbi:hypothetical protein C7I55_08985 [Sphingomonas deserti]|uniref:Uncharacterized protein n=2 Tax=Allosphingosinicella deserti TaxID=2116704 RepID=A0A2P7QR76_9SPHN|nr:hypothetical protein C7I55_08985 [Sphingomonas deserti]
MPAHARINTKPVVERACSGATAGAQEIPRAVLAEFILADAGLRVTEVTQGETGAAAGELMRNEIMRAYHSYDQRSVAAPTPAQKHINFFVQQLELEMSKDPRSTRIGAPFPDSKRPWLFTDDRNAVLRCEVGKERKDSTESARLHPRLMLRNSVEDLTASEFKKAGSAKFGYTRVRSRLENGTTKTDSTWTVDATLGLMLGSERSPLPKFVYASYKRQHARTRPEPVLPTGQDQSDADLDVLEGGLGAGFFLPGFHQLTLAGALVTDLNRHSERLKARADLLLAFTSADLGVCALGRGSIHHVAGWRFATRCSITLTAQANHVLDNGSAEFGKNSEFLLAGGQGKWELFPYDNDGPAARVAYRREFRLAGTAPSIKRLDIFAGYRIFASPTFAVDVGLNYARGEDEKSLEHEDRLELSFGVLF